MYLLPLPHPKVRRNMFPVASVSFIALHLPLSETALDVPGQSPHHSAPYSALCDASSAQG